MAETGIYDQQIQEQLSIQRLLTIRQNETQEALDEAKPPSLFIYTLFGIFAFGVDILDFFELGADATGYGLILVILLDICIALIFIFLGYLASGRIQKIQRANKKIEDRVMQTGISSNQLVSSISAVGETILNPGRKNLKYSLLQIIPGIDLWPWQTMGVYHLYKSHKAAYQQAQDLQQQYEELAAQEVESFEQTS